MHYKPVINLFVDLAEGSCTRPLRLGRLPGGVWLLSVTHKRSHSSRWMLKKEARKEFDQLLRRAYYDREKAETVALTSCPLLDVVRGEVVRNPRYRRKFWFE